MTLRARRSGAVLGAALVCLVLSAGQPRSASAQAQQMASTTFSDAGARALETLLTVYYAGAGEWNQCDHSDCSPANSDWGVDSLTYALALGWESSRDPRIPTVMRALSSTSPQYLSPCMGATCRSWSDVPEWDAIADLREYEVTADPQALADAEAAFRFVQGSDAFALGACPDVPYQQPGGGSNRLKTLETDANAVKAAVLLYQATGDHAYLNDAVTAYAAIRARFLDASVPLYSVYVFDDGTTCKQLPHRFFASINGDMILCGYELSKDTGQDSYLAQALASARAVAVRLDDPAGVFADLQAENDVVEPLVEAMYILATEAHSSVARSWILTNAAAALSARTPDGSFGRFFDGPPPRATVTAWQTNGGLALEIAAAALDPAGVVRDARRWSGARRVARSLGPNGNIRFTGSGIALVGTLGEACCEAGHARVLVDGRETFDGTGIWQNKSSLGIRLPGTILFSWRWRSSGTHTVAFLPGAPNAKEGGPFLHVRGYLVLR